jgi:hypothetical protein
MVKLTKRDLALLGGAIGVADFLAEGKLSAPVARALKRYVIPAAGRGLARSPGTTAGLIARGASAAKFVALRHPVLTAGAIVYYGYKNRKELGRLVEQGYDVLQDTREMLPEMGSGSPQIRMAATPARKKSTFNRAVSAGLKALKGSASYGKRGVLSNAKAAFKTATKAASARSKGKKMPKSGPAKIAYKAAKGVYTDEILRRKMK